MSTKIEIQHIFLEEIYVDHDFNCRGLFSESDVKSLSENIQQHGLLNAIIVRSQIRSKFKYVIVSGHRRFVACQMLGWKRIPCRVIELNNIEAENVNAIENIHRLDLNMYQEAKAIEHLLHLPLDTIADIVNKNMTWVDCRRMLLELPVEIQKLAAIGYLHQTHIREIYMRQTEPAAIKKIIRLIEEAKNRDHFIDLITKTTVIKKKPLVKNLMQAYDRVKEYYPENELAQNCLLWAANKISKEEFEGVLKCSLSTPKPADSMDQPS